MTDGVPHIMKFELVGFALIAKTMRITRNLPVII